MTLPFNRIFDFRLLTRDRQRNITQKAFDRCGFDFDKLRPGLDHFGGGRILIKPANGWMGSYIPDKRMIKMWFGMWGERIQGAFIHEMAHAADLLVLRPEERATIFAALHNGEQPEAMNNLPSTWAVYPPAPNGHGHFWFDQTYKEGVGEAFAEVFIATFTDIQPASGYTHQVTPEAIETVQRILG